MKKRYILCPLLIFVLILTWALPALCEINRTSAYSGPELVFQMPDDMEICDSEETADTCFRTFYSPNLCESFMTGVFPDTQSAEDKLYALFGEAVSVQTNDSFDSLTGYPARWLSFVAGNGESSAYVNAVIIEYRRTLLFISSVPLESYRSDDNAETYSGILCEQIASLAIYDPDIRLTIAMDDDFILAGQAPLADIVIDQEAEPFVLTAAAPITDVRLVALLADDEGHLSAGDTLGCWEKLSPGQSIRIRAWFPELFPTLGISYITAEGESCLRLITDSKLDGTPLLIEGQLDSQP